MQRKPRPFFHEKKSNTIQITKSGLRTISRVFNSDILSELYEVLNSFYSKYEYDDLFFLKEKHEKMKNSEKQSKKNSEKNLKKFFIDFYIEFYNVFINLHILRHRIIHYIMNENTIDPMYHTVKGNILEIIKLNTKIDMLKKYDILNLILVC